MQHRLEPPGEKGHCVWIELDRARLAHTDAAQQLLGPLAHRAVEHHVSIRLLFHVFCNPSRSALCPLELLLLLLFSRLGAAVAVLGVSLGVGWEWWEWNQW